MQYVSIVTHNRVIFLTISFVALDFIMFSSLNSNPYNVIEILLEFF